MKQRVITIKTVKKELNDYRKDLTQCGGQSKMIYIPAVRRDIAEIIKKLDSLAERTLD